MRRSPSGGLARIAWLARAVEHLIVGAIAVWAVLFRPAGGALRVLLQQSWGRPLLCVAAVAITIWALWRLVEAFGHVDDELPWGRQFGFRLGLLLSAIAHLAIATWLGDLVVDGRLLDGLGFDPLLAASRGGNTMLSFVLAWPFGAGLLVAIGVVLVLLAVGQLAVAGRRPWQWTHAPSGIRGLLDPLGVLGHVGRGLVFLAIGAIVCLAGILSLPGTALGSGDVIAFVRGGPYGIGTYGLVAAAFGLFGLYCLAEAAIPRTTAGPPRVHPYADAPIR